MRNWTDESVHTEVAKIAEGLGHFPSKQELTDLKRNDLAVQVSRRGGYLAWAQKTGFERIQSDSDTGWAGEVAFSDLAKQRGLESERPKGVKSPFDLLLDKCLRVDVKSARFAQYGVCRGWFYRIGKYPQADLILLFQLDTNDFYGLPWFVCPRSNVTISQDGGKYASFKNNWPLIL
jgi:hypothetical protein